MAKYVDADKMLKEYEHGIYDTTDLAEMLYYMPAADVVEVGRCKDCKHRGYQYRDFHGTEKVVCWKYGYGIQKNANGYCDDWDFRDEKDGDEDYAQ